MNILNIIATGLLEVRSLTRRRVRRPPRHWQVGQVDHLRPIGTLPR